MKPKVLKDGRRTPYGQRLFCSVQAVLKAHGWSAQHRALKLAIGEILPEYPGESEASLRNQYYRIAKALPPEEDRWTSDLQRWGLSPLTSRELADRLIKIVTIKISVLGLPYIDWMFDRIRHSRRLRTAQSKIKWLERAADKLESGRLPIRPWDQASNVNIERIKAALREGRSTVEEVAAACKEIKRRTVQDLLAFMESTGEAARKKHGHYGPPQEGAAAYVRPGEAVLKALERGGASSAEIRKRTGLTKAQVTAALHWLWRKARKIERPKPDLYCLPGAALMPPHIYAHDAFALALVSGKKSMSEVVEITGKNRPELWRGFRCRLFPDGIAKRIGFRNRSDVRRGLRGREAVFALTAKGRWRTKQAA